MKAIRERRIAKFEIPLRIINDATPAALVILQGLLVVRAESQQHKNAIEYIAYGDQFPPSDNFSEPPIFRPIIKDLIGGKYHVEWERVP